MKSQMDEAKDYSGDNNIYIIPHKMPTCAGGGGAYALIRLKSSRSSLFGECFKV